MFKVIKYPRVQDFFNANKKVIYNNRLAHYHLIQYFAALNSGEQSVYQAYNVTDDDGGNVIAVWGDSVYYLYALKWSDSIIDGLLSKIEIAKYTKRFSFAGTCQLILDLFDKSGIEYEIYKERVLYECGQILPISACKGSAFLSSFDDINTIAKMTYEYGVAEWGIREGRDLNHARLLSMQSVSQQTSYHWEMDGKIVTIASLIDPDTELPIIGSLYTNPEDRGKGYAKCLVHKITSEVIENKKRCGIVSDASNHTTNRIFKEVGFNETSRYVSVHTLRESV